MLDISLIFNNIINGFFNAIFSIFNCLFKWGFNSFFRCFFLGLSIFVDRLGSFTFFNNRCIYRFRFCAYRGFRFCFRLYNRFKFFISEYETGAGEFFAIYDAYGKDLYYSKNPNLVK